jgi:hypothetical protein
VDPIALRQLLAPLDPDEGALSNLFRANVEESMLRELAEGLRLEGG